MTATEWMWVTIGAAGQTLYGARMIVQWWVSERNGKSIVPVSFWYMSFVASVLTMAYAIFRRDPVFIAPQLLGLAVYSRNLTLIRSKRNVQKPAEDSLPLRTTSCTCACTCGASTPAKAA